MPLRGESSQVASPPKYNLLSFDLIYKYSTSNFELMFALLSTILDKLVIVLE